MFIHICVEMIQRLVSEHFEGRVTHVTRHNNVWK